MAKKKVYENFPFRTVFLSNIVSILICTIGGYIFLGFGFMFSILYGFYCLLMEFRLLRKACVNCYYYGKVCGFGRGKLCSFLFKKGNPKKFTEREITWLSILPDFMIFLLPLMGGVILLIMNFNWLILGLTVVLFFLGFAGNAMVRGCLV
jgi:hypothetical protein